MANFRDLLRQVKEEIGETTPEAVKERLDGGDKLSLLDVREQEEVENGIVPGARTLSRAHFESRVEDVLPNKDEEVVVYCASGVRSAFATRTLLELGYSNVLHMTGGFNQWRDLGYDLQMPRVLG